MVAPLEDAIHKRRRANEGEAKSKKTAKERDKKETREMFGPCCDKTYVYETSSRKCRSAFQNPSTALGHPRISAEPGRGWVGGRRRSLFPRPQHRTRKTPNPRSQWLYPGKGSELIGKFGKFGKEMVNSLLQCRVQIVIVVSQVLSHSPDRQRVCHAGKDRRPIGIGPKDEPPIGQAMRDGGKTGMNENKNPQLVQFESSGLSPRRTLRLYLACAPRLMAFWRFPCNSVRQVQAGRFVRFREQDVVTAKFKVRRLSSERFLSM